MAPLLPALVDLILLLLVLEAALLWWLPGRRSTAPPRAGLLLTLASGACLVIAVRAALAESPSGILAALTGAGIAHAGYLLVTLTARP